MKNMFYFLKKYGSKTFKEFPFNEVDSLILCQLSYLNFDGLVPTMEEGRKNMPFSALNDPFTILKITRGTLDPKHNVTLLHMIFGSRRYKGMRVNYYTAILDHQSSEQFSAITFFFKDFMYVAYRGTDTTLIGWKEDFMMVIDKKIPAQKQSIEYLAAVAKKSSLPIYVGGHSKGGNLSYYSSLFCTKKIKERIQVIYNHDGPGFHDDVFATKEYELIKGKTHKSVPKNDVIGILMHHSTPDMIVKAKGVGILQHSPFNWLVGPDGHFKNAHHISRSSKIMDKSLNEVVDDMTRDEKVKIVDTIFDLMGISTPVTVTDLMDHPMLYAKEVRKRYRKLPKDDKKLLISFLKAYEKAHKMYAKQLKEEEKK